ncbi:hypothetical protein BSKO_12687 [Bryopsis sp. KO-2023]|nr:hypothetical protein BSKO_12687 [Bryopsis sp. KO-2023]
MFESWRKRGKENIPDDGGGCKNGEPMVPPLPKRRKKKSASKKKPDRVDALYPFSFFAREKVFRKSHTVKKRDTGFCRVKRGILGAWHEMFVTIEGSRLFCRKPNARLGAKKVSTPPIMTIDLIATKVTATGPDRFTLKPEKAKRISFITPSPEDCKEWLYKFQNTPGMYRRVEDFYEVGPIWGEGATCRVRECKSVITGEIVALKMRADPTDVIGRQGMYNELRILQLMAKKPHPSIPRLVDYFFDEQGDIKLVLELMSGGELLNRVVRKKHFTEKAAQNVFRQIAEGVQHLHLEGIAHRDLKPSNIMFSDETDDSVKIIDYDLSKENYARQWYGGTPVGTTDFMAPEIVQKQRYTLAIDMWSLGCVLYILLCGDIPFTGANSEETRQSILQGIVRFEGPVWEKVSESAKDLVRGLLEMDATQRLTVEQVLKHPWMVGTSVPSTTLSIQKTLSASMSSDNLHKLELLHKEVALADVPEMTDQDRLVIHNMHEKRAKAKWKRNLDLLKARLTAHRGFTSFDGAVGGPSTPNYSEGDLSTNGGVCQKSIFIKAFGSAPDLCGLNDEEILSANDAELSSSTMPQTT